MVLTNVYSSRSHSQEDYLVIITQLFAVVFRDDRLLYFLNYNPELHFTN